MRSRMAGLLSALVSTYVFAAPTQAHAQRANENALSSAEDAFGTSIGRESIGLYSPSDVRGFSPFAAGNIRLEGLYIDTIPGLNGRLVQGSTIRVGISAQGYPFPAPTGIADFRLRLPGAQPVASTLVTAFSDRSAAIEVDAQLPVNSRLGIGLGGSLSHDEVSFGRPGKHVGATGLLRWRPIENLEIIPFWSGFFHRDDSTQPRIITAGAFLPPKFDRHRKVDQPWARNNTDDINFGSIGRLEHGAFTLNAGVFRSVRETRSAFTDQFLGTSEEGRAENHRIVATPQQKFASTSGEIRFTHQTIEGPRRHRLHVAARARDQKRRYGGASSIDFGPTLIADPGIEQEPEFVFGVQSREAVKQMSAGLAYEGQWRKVGELSMGLQKTRYSKTADIPGREEPVTKSSPWLYNVALAAHLSDRLALYGGFTRGLEESPVAPDVAVNKDEGPPAILTRQYDAGLRWAITPPLRLIAGLFNVEKPYFNTDSERVYRRLGEVRHRGVELSLSGRLLPNLTLVAGAVLLDAKVRGEAVTAGLVGDRPVGSTNRTIILNAEYQLPSIPGLSVDVGLNSVGKRIANTAATLKVPAAETVSAGLRYRWQTGGVPLALRLQVNNALNAYVWEVRGSNAFFYNTPRLISVRLTADLK